jgi:folate-binding protein YgfZ
MRSEWYQLADACCFSVTGKDARRYLHNRLSQDIRALSINGQAQAAALSAQGRVEGYFSVYCKADDEFIVVADGGDRDLLKSVLTRFIVADRVNVSELPDPLQLIHFSARYEDVREALEAEGIVPECCYSRRRIASVGTDVLVLGDNVQRLVRYCHNSLGSSLSQEQYGLRRWKCGIPSYPEELSDQIILTEAGMLEAVCFSKGCYVGQEVIERSDAIGKLPRTLERCVCDGPASIELGAAVLNQQGESIGKAISVYSDSAAARECLYVLLKTGKYTPGERVSCGGASGTLVAREECHD